METCVACGHDSMVHQQFVGCCGVEGCVCVSMDGGVDRCAKAEHGSDCWWTKVKPDEPVLTEAEFAEIWRLKNHGGGAKTIGQTLGFKRRFVQLVLQGHIDQTTLRSRVDWRISEKVEIGRRAPSWEY